ncbi:hypothetical protein HK098_005501 [Nowakowskiella sp. JEL0407]|nr:hypothetical protein HK098_005501 [Nowakowskiella sp. JEL0407]
MVSFPNNALNALKTLKLWKSESFLVNSLLVSVFLISAAGLGFSHIAFAPALIIALIILYVRIHSLPIASRISIESDLTSSTNASGLNGEIFQFIVSLLKLGVTLSLSVSLTLYENPGQVSVQPIQGADYAVFLIFVGLLYSFLVISAVVFAEFYYLKVRRGNDTHRFVELFIFPIVWTLFWRMLAIRWLPMGSWGNWGHILLTGYGSVNGWIQSVSVFGAEIGDFVVAAIGQFMAEMICFGYSILPQTDQVVDNLIDFENETVFEDAVDITESNESEALIQHEESPKVVNLSKGFTIPLMRFPVQLHAIAIFVLFCNLTIFGAVQQKYSPDFVASNKVTLGCVLPPTSTNENLFATMMRTTATLGTRAKIVLWSESALEINHQHELMELFNRSALLAAKERIVLGIAYNTRSERNPRLKSNRLTVFDPEGKILFNYTKSNLVFIAESHNFETGDGEVPIKNVNLTVPLGHKGRKRQISVSISGVICHDLDFPGFMRKVGSSSVLLVPAKTWSGTSGNEHMEITRLRAAEQGVTILRCDGGGVSGVVDSIGEKRFWSYINSNDVERYEARGFLVEVPIAESIRKTFYSWWGDIVWVVIATSVGLFNLKFAEHFAWSTIETLRKRFQRS